MGLKDFIARVGKRRTADTEPEVPLLENHVPQTLMEITEPMGSVAADFIFPLAFSIGEIPVRVRPLRLMAGLTAFDPIQNGPWFFWKMETAAGKAGGYWQLPGPAIASGSDAVSSQAWVKTATTLASAAATSLKTMLAAIPGIAPTAFSAGPCVAPQLDAKPVMRVDFRYLVKSAYREGRAYTSQSYPAMVAKALGCDPSVVLVEDPIDALSLASRFILDGSLAGIWTKRCFKYREADRILTTLPIYELCNMLCDNDLRLVVQNYLSVKIRGPRLGALFTYKHRVKTDAGEREQIVHPHSYDHERLNPLFPESVLSDGWLDPVHAASNLDDFITRNEAALDDLFKSVTRDTLSLSGDGARLVRSIYVTLIYPGKRSRLDAMIREGYPMQELRTVPERIARRAVDTSGARILAAMVYGSQEALAYISRWCSRRKQEAINEETRRLEVLLKDGLADIDAVLADRTAILDKAQSLLEADRLEIESSRKRSAHVTDGG